MVSLWLSYSGGHSDTFMNYNAIQSNQYHITWLYSSTAVKSCLTGCPLFFLNIYLHILTINR